MRNSSELSFGKIEIVRWSTNAMSDDQEKPKPVYAPAAQTKLPGFKPYISSPPIDWRKWEDGRGNKVDAPAYRGQQFTGKTVPPLTDSHGNPFKDGSLQIQRDARGVYSIIDWSLPIDAYSAENFASPIMGRAIYHTKYSLDRAKAALAILAREKRELLAGLQPDPVQCLDLEGKTIAIGHLFLQKLARGKYAGRYIIINKAVDVTLPARGLIIRAKTLKEAVARLEKESRTSTGPKPKKKFVGPPIMFEAPAGFGGFGAGFNDREGPAPDSLSWDTIVELYARTGDWCKTARMIWPMGNYPAELVEQVTEYRKEYLANPDAFYDFPERKEIDPKVREKLERDPIIQEFVSEFGATLIDVVESRT